MANLLVSPLGLGLLLLLIRLLARKLSNIWISRIASTGMALCALLMTPLGANALIHWIEYSLKPIPECTRAQDRAVVLLAGGLDHQPHDEQDFGALTSTSLQRLIDLRQSHLLDGHQDVLISGGNPQGGISESRLMRNLAASLGVKPSRITLDESSASTLDNANRVAQIMRAKGLARIVLVTSAWHMRRALLVFQDKGLDVCPLPVDSIYNPPGDIGYFLPQSSALVKSETALHELAGILFYSIKFAH
ncbi:MAG: YdcF family protein [Burkholderiales bacterium]|nr:YdcF family protein [Burkholderiales bacterium]